MYYKIPVSQLTDMQIEEIAKVFLRLRENLLQHNFEPHIYFNHKTKEPVDFWIFPMALYEKEHKLSENFTANEAVSIFYQHKRDVLAFKSLKESLKSQVVKHIKKTRQNLAYLEERLNKTSDLEKYKLWGDLLSANLYQIKPGQNQVLLPNFYNQNEKILIPLNEKLTPSHNAQIYFNRYKKLKATKEIVKKRINDALMEIEYLESTFLNIEQSKNIEDLSEILQELESQNYIKRTKQKRHKVEVSKPLRFKSSDGTIIYVGKNNRQNDFLTFKKSKPDDIWLHAKNTPGSHVIIETQGKVVSDETLTEAAILAAYFSNGRDSSNVPVDYTLVRHVKKPSGAKPGFVIYDRQKTLYVTPDEKLSTIYRFSITTLFSPSTSVSLTSTISSLDVGTFFPTKSGLMGNSRCPLSINTANCMVLARPRSARASRAALTVLPVYMTSSTKTILLSVISKGISVLCTTGEGARRDKSSR